MKGQCIYPISDIDELDQCHSRPPDTISTVHGVGGVRTARLPSGVEASATPSPLSESCGLVFTVGIKSLSSSSRSLSPAPRLYCSVE